MSAEKGDATIDKAFNEFLVRCVELVWSPPVNQKPAMTRFLAAAWVLRHCPKDAEEILSNNEPGGLPDALREALKNLSNDDGTCNDFKQRRSDFKVLLNRVLQEMGLGALPAGWYEKDYFGLAEVLKTTEPLNMNGEYLYICNTDGPKAKEKEAYGGFFKIQQETGSREWVLEGHRTWNGSEKFTEGHYKPWDTHWGAVFNTSGREIIRYAYKIRYKDLHIEGYGASTAIELDDRGNLQRANGEFWHHPQVDPRWGTFVFRRRGPGESVYWEDK